MAHKRRRPGRLCGGLGVLLLAAALGLVAWNTWDNHRAAESAEQILAEMSALPGPAEIPQAVPPASQSAPASAKMPTVIVDGSAYIGTLQIPALGLRLPVLRDWSYPNLRIAPCRYAGTPQGSLVLAAHNYESHFGRLDELRPGDTVQFTDAAGSLYAYMVAQVEILQPAAIEEMIDPAWDLTLFTCTLGGQTRLTVRCMRS